MRTLVILGLAAVAVASPRSPTAPPPPVYPSSPPPTSACAHGDVYLDECENLCTCDPGTTTYACTEKACLPGKEAGKPLTCSGGLPWLHGKRVVCHQGIVKVQELGAPCLPGNSSFVDGQNCNGCFCGDTGVIGCTFRLCEKTFEGESCPAGASFLDQCENACHCTEHSTYGSITRCGTTPCRPGREAGEPLACSGTADLPWLHHRRVICHEGVVKLQAPDDDCLPGSVFKDGENCNDCRCSEPPHGVLSSDGTPPVIPSPFAACTLKACIKMVPGNNCQWGQTYWDECDNLCHCGGGDYTCNAKPCLPGRKSGKPLTCQTTGDLPNIPIQGQRAVCHENIVKVQGSDDDCLPGSVFKDEENCNDCFCSEPPPVEPSYDGTPPVIPPPFAACTQKACILQKLVPGNNCQWGQTYWDECDNLCHCDGGDYTCNTKPCLPGRKSGKPLTCQTAGDLPLPDRRPAGTSVVCHEGVVKVQKPGEPCLEGSTFMDAENCNSCRCGANGVAGCTIKACVKAIHVCQYGPKIVDECGNTCNCYQGAYSGCTSRPCEPGQQSGVARTCKTAGDLPFLGAGTRVFCHDGVVKVQEPDEPCLERATFMDSDGCNTCSCFTPGKATCTRKGCERPPY